jgi:hypothetical protein
LSKTSYLHHLQVLGGMVVKLGAAGTVPVPAVHRLAPHTCGPKTADRCGCERRLAAGDVVIVIVIGCGVSDLAEAEQEAAQVVEVDNAGETRHQYRPDDEKQKLVQCHRNSRNSFAWRVDAAESGCPPSTADHHHRLDPAGDRG